jgi:hypothetical protein
MKEVSGMKKVSGVRYCHSERSEESMVPGVRNQYQVSGVVIYALKAQDIFSPGQRPGGKYIFKSISPERAWHPTLGIMQNDI